MTTYGRVVRVGAGTGGEGTWVTFLDFLAEGGGVQKTEERDAGTVRFLVERRRTCDGLSFLGDLLGVEASWMLQSFLIKSTFLGIVNTVKVNFLVIINRIDICNKKIYTKYNLPSLATLTYVYR